MRKVYLMLAVAICVASPLALAQVYDSSAQSTAVATTVQPQAADASTDRAAAPAPKKSAFGQVMAVLTTLLQEAASKQSGTSSDAPLHDTASADSALTITVTPIAGRTTFTAEDTDREAIPPVADDPSTDDVRDIDRAQLAVQGEDGAG